MRLKCFIASAFGHADVDQIYDEVIRPVTKKLGFTPRRVDRVEHNEDIDDKILSLMEDSDLCIADLTYARPSVYFEVGHMAGCGKPVVYICRSDHFRQKLDDPHGNLRVHFDLQMKNIIPWTQPNESFKKRLTSRLKHVRQPILRQLARREELSLAKSAFQALSTKQELEALRKTGAALLKRRRYTLPDGGGSYLSRLVLRHGRRQEYWTRAVHCPCSACGLLHKEDAPGVGASIVAR